MKKYVYDRIDWPDLEYDEKPLIEKLISFHHAQGRLFGKLDTLGFDVQDELLLSAVSDEVTSSSEIEGEKLNRDSVRSSVAKKLGLDTAGLVHITPDHYTEGVVEMALDATQNYSQTVSAERLFGWHSALFPTGRSGISRIIVGAYRKEEMTIVSGAFGKEKIHYRAPSPDMVSGEMISFLKWLETENDVDPYIKAGISHFRFEMIHPFDDGNGRIGRAVADLLLARAEKSPKRYYSLSSQFLNERKAYYNELEAVSGFSGDLGRWLAWFLGCLTRAVEASEMKLDAAKQKAMIFDRFRNTAMNKRQVAMLNRQVDGFEGKLTAEKWAKICKCSHDTALRDIDDLIEKGIMARSAAGGRSTSYELRRY